MLSNTCKYAVRAVIYISVFASDKKKVGIKEISSELDIPSPFLGKILQSLSKHKILNSTKGPNGGFTLSKSAEEIALMDIVEIIDGTDIFTTCLIRTSECSDDTPCGLHQNITAVRKQLRSTFVNQSINDLASEFKRNNGKISI
jgi:Rrf2 family transcriptional regulator, iron-sulfur cluster assembly transcription factor